MKIKPRDVEGVPQSESEKLRARDAVKSKEGQANQASQRTGETDIKVSLELARELNSVLTQAFDSDENDPERRKKVEELKRKYEKGELSYDSTVVAQSVIKELF